MNRDKVIEMMLDRWAEHRANEPADAEGEYAVHVEHLRIRRDNWEKSDDAWRLLVGVRLAEQAIEEYEARGKQ